MKLYESITNNLRETDMDKLIDNDMTIKELDDTAKWLYNNDRDEWDKFTDNELLELAKLCQYTEENPWGRPYDDEVFDEMDKRGLSLHETENLKEAVGTKKFFITKFADDEDRNGEEVEIINFRDGGRLDIKFVSDGKVLKNVYDNEVKRVTYNTDGGKLKMITDDLGEYKDKIIKQLKEIKEADLKEMDNSNGLTNIQFVEYCKDKLANLGTIEVKNWDDEPVQVKVAFEQPIRDYGICKVLDGEDTMDKLDSDGETLEFVDEKGEYHNSPMINPITLVGRLEFDKIDRKFYKSILQYWDDIVDFFEGEKLKEAETVGTTSPYVMLEELLKYAERYLSKEISQYCSNYINIKIQKAPDGQYQVVLPNTHEAIDAWLKVHDDKYVAEAENLKESYNDIANEVKDVVYNVFDGTDFLVNGVELMDDGWITFNVAAFDGSEDGMERSVEIQVPELNYLDAVREKCEEWMHEHDSPDNFYDSENLKEAYVEKLGGDPEDYISDIQLIKNKLNEIDYDKFGTKLAYEVWEQFDDTCDAQIKMTKDRFIKEAEEEPAKQLWVYVSKHGLGPGTIPNDVEAQYVTSLPNTGKDIFSVSRELTPEELDKYELKLFDNSYFAKYPEVVKELFELKDE